jgi:hypothetical protein
VGGGRAGAGGGHALGEVRTLCALGKGNKVIDSCKMRVDVCGCVCVCVDVCGCGRI